MISKINILGLDYEIKQVPVIDNDKHVLGQIDYIEQMILIDEEQSEQRKEQTLFHEVMHGVLEQLGLTYLSEDEEKVQSIALAPHQTFKPFISFKETTVSDLKKAIRDSCELLQLKSETIQSKLAEVEDLQEDS